MKLAVDLRKLSLRPSGIGIYTYNILKELIKKDIQIIGICDVIESKQIINLKNSGIEIFVYGKEVNNNIEVFRYFKFIEEKLREVSPDVFWEPNFIIPINLKKRFPNIKFVINIHDMIPILNKEYCSRIYSLYFKIFLSRTVKFIDGVIYISKDGKNKAESYFDILKNKTSIVNYPIIDVNKDISDCKDDDFFLYVGNIEKRKGIDILISAYTNYLKSGGKNRLILCGGIKEEFYRLLIEKSMSDTKGMIEYRGYIDECEKENLLKKCSAFVFPSYAEGFGIPPIEAIIYGKPVIVSNIEVFKETMSEYANYFNIKDDNVTCVVENLKNKLLEYNICIANTSLIENKFDIRKGLEELIEFLKVGI